MHVSELRHTARFVCTTDADHAQIASFYAGAMREARDIELEPVAARMGGIDLVVISANDPEAMLRHTEECRTRGYPFLADPGQQIAWMDGAGIRQLIDGATYLFTNEYEAALTEQKTGWSAEEILDRVGTRVVTLGAKGARIERKDEPTAARRVHARGPQGRPDRRRRRASGPASSPASPGACRWSAAPRSAACSRPTSSRPWAPRSTSWARRGSSSGSRRRYGPEAVADVAPHVRCPRP